MSELTETQASHEPKRGIRDNHDHCKCGWVGSRGLFGGHFAAMFTIACSSEQPDVTFKPATVDTPIGLPVCIEQEGGHRKLGRLAAIWHDQDGTHLTITEER